LNFDESYRGCWLVKKCDGDTRDAAYPLIPWLTFGLLIDHRLNCIMTANFAEYHVPVHADAHDIKLIFADEAADSNPFGGRDRYRRRRVGDHKCSLSSHCKARTWPGNYKLRR